MNPTSIPAVVQPRLDAESMEFVGDATSGRDARRAAGELLARHHASQECADAVLLVLSELVTNAIRHGGGAFVLRAAVSAHSVDIALSDGDPAPPRARVPDLLDGTGGFGSLIVDRLARHVSVDGRPDGKTVHVTVDFDRSTPEVV
ncbi:ATP-binding protein [Streptomyces sp. SBC-4]|nr:ATP-binding protein [Streptomyces sp. SBC-4]MDV5143716.1 ATP-binding protein [Streptomyces sp. SBC-4]